MKKFIILILVTILSISLQSQTKQQFNKIVDSVYNMKRQYNYNQDTLWVMDSSYRYYTTTQELAHQRTYKVMTRNDVGNVITSQDLIQPDFPDTIAKNDVFDSIVYFNGNEIHKHYSSIRKRGNDQWFDNQYEEFSSPEVLKESYYKGMSYNPFQYNEAYRLYANNHNGRRDSLFQYRYIDATDSWRPIEKILYHYDNQNRDTLQFVYNWENNAWQDNIKHKFIYQGSQLKEELSLIIVNETNTWKDYLHTFYSYNNLGLEDTCFTEYWHFIENKWIDESKTIKTYDEQNRLVNLLTMYDKYNNGQLENYQNYDVEYQDGHKIENYKRRISNGTWVDSEQYYTSYIIDDIIDTLHYIKWSVNGIVLMQEDLTVNKYDQHFNNIESNFSHIDYNYMVSNYSKTNYYWSAFTPTAITEISTNALAVYPNPASNQVTFALADILPKQDQQISIKIFNISGQKISEIPLKEDKVIWDCSYEKSGIYVYSAVVDGLALTGKLIVK